MEALTVAYNELANRQQPTTTIDDENVSYDCYELNTFSRLSALIANKVAAKYVHIESLWEPEENAKVFNLMFFDDDEELVGGCELTPNKLYWDDDVTEVT